MKISKSDLVAMILCILALFILWMAIIHAPAPLEQQMLTTPMCNSLTYVGKTAIYKMEVCKK